MQKRLVQYVCSLIFVALAAGLPLRAQSADQGKAPMYSYISEWAVPRAQWADMEKLDDQEKSLMDKLIADGTIVSYASFTNLLHQEGEPTHGTWFSAMSEGKLLKALEAVYAQGTTTAPVQAASKHWDYLTVSRLYNQRSGKFDGGYLIVSFWNVKPGHMHEVRDLEKNNIVPVLEKLLAEGTVTAYGMETEDFHAGKLGRADFYVTVSDAAAMDTVDKALDDVFEKNPALEAAFRSMTESEGHRDYLLRLRYMANK
ncbi:MAG: hypothetical protein LAN62_12615 [Acidobacteriia bacterium]|nr:hypothetical protein [Terriglobia bacterium]